MFIGCTVGIRSEWRCVNCGRFARAHQIVTARAPDLEPPAGWTIENGKTYCAQHSVTELKAA